MPSVGSVRRIGGIQSKDLLHTLDGHSSCRPRHKVSLQGSPEGWKLKYIKHRLIELRVKYIFVYFYFDYKIKGSMHSSVYLPNRHKRVKLIAMSSVPTALGNPELRQAEVLDNGRNANNRKGRTQGQ